MEGLGYTAYLTGSVITSNCQAANRRVVRVDASTSHGGFVPLQAEARTDDPSLSSTFISSSYDNFYLQPSTATVDC